MNVEEHQDQQNIFFTSNIPSLWDDLKGRKEKKPFQKKVKSNQYRLNAF